MEKSSDFLSGVGASKQHLSSQKQTGKTENFNARFNMLLQELTDDLSKSPTHQHSFAEYAFSKDVNHQLFDTLDEMS